jgi:two-component system, response regulator YesN
MRLLLVDDEPLTAKWIESVLSYPDSEYQIVDTAYDGYEALRKISETQVDTVITDIKMPEMSGLDLIREIKGINNNIRILIISSYSDFRFTSEAIRLGADDYLLKSEISEIELKSALKRITSITQEHSYDSGAKEVNEKQKNRLLLSQLNRLCSEEYLPVEERDSIFQKLNIHSPPVFCILLKIQASRALDNPIGELYKYVCSHKQLLGDHITVIAVNSELICITGQAMSINTVHPEKKLLSGITAILQQIKQIHSINIHYGLSSIRSSAEDFHTLYKEAETALELNSFYKEKDLSSLRGLSLTELQTNRKDIELLISEVKRELNLENWMYALQKAEAIVNSIENELPITGGDAKEIVSELYLHLSENYSSASVIAQINSCNSFEELKELSKEIFSQLQTEKKEPLSGKNITIEKVCSYIENNFYDSQMSLISVSEYIGLNSTYLSDLFRKKMGITFQHYLSKIRIEKAEYLLEYSNASITEITEQVGFHSTSYFSRFFRKSHGISPTEYRNQKKRQ